MLLWLMLYGYKSLNPWVLVPVCLTHIWKWEQKEEGEDTPSPWTLWMQAYGDSLCIHKCLLRREGSLVGRDGQPCGMPLTRGSRVVGMNTSDLLGEELEGAKNSFCRKCFRRRGPTSAQRDGLGAFSRADLTLFLVWFRKEMGVCPSFPMFLPALTFQSFSHLELNVTTGWSLQREHILASFSALKGECPC